MKSNVLATSFLFVIICLVALTTSTPELSSFNDASRSLKSTVMLETNASSSPINQTTINPSYFPTKNPTLSPTLMPTLLPSLNPTESPTSPTELPSIWPTILPSTDPSTRPTVEPTLVPSAPSTMPTINPTKSPSTSPTVLPTNNPSMTPTNTPSVEPTAVPSRPTHVPTETPSVSPTLTPTVLPTNIPTQVPTKSPTENPTIEPSAPTIVPTNKPSKTPTDHPSWLPTTTPTYIPTHNPTTSPTQKPTYPEVNLPEYYNWYYVDINSHTFFVAFMVYFALYVVYTIASCCCIVGWTDDQKMDFKYYSSIFLAFYWILFETILLCARMTHLLNLPSGTYQPRFTTSHTMVWLGPAYDTAGPNTRFNAGCPAESDLDHHASYDVCKFLFLPLNAEIMIEGAVKFSVGLGIGIYFVIQMTIAVIDASFEWNRAQNPDALPLYQIRMISIALKMTFGCLQAVVLLPLQAMQMNPYCAFLETPMSQKQTMCVFKWAAVAIPYGIPMAVGAAIFAKLAKGEDNLSAICGIISFCLGLCSGGLFTIYIFAGIPLGIWFKIAAIGNEYLLESALFLDVLASTGVYLPALNQALLGLVAVREDAFDNVNAVPAQDPDIN